MVQSGQAQVNLGFGAAIYIVYCAYGYNYVTGNINLIVACADYLACCILHGVHVDGTAGCIDCAIAILLIGINDVDFTAVNVNGCTANVSKQAVAYAGNINIAVYVNSTASCSAVACMCINACCAVFVEAAALAVQYYFHVAVNGGAACMAVNAHGGVITLNVNIYVAINGQITIVLTDSLRALAALFAVQLNNQLVSFNSAVYIYVLRNTCIALACFGYERA